MKMTLNRYGEWGIDEKDIPALKGKLKGKSVKRKPRTVAVILASDDARDKIMSNRSRLKKYEDGSYLWVNEELPEMYKRKKSMLRDLIKLAKKRGYKDAKLESGGIKIQGKLQSYTEDNFNELPEEIQPKQVRIRKTKNNGLAFCSEWAYVSNFYFAPFQYKEKLYGTVEQCYQSERALFHNKEALSERIIRTEDPLKCKRMGEEIAESLEWIGVRETIMRGIAYQKFAQNDELKKDLLNTGDSRLYEAVSGVSVWSTNSSIYSKATYEETATGPNALGKILEGIRTSFKPLPESETG